MVQLEVVYFFLELRNGCWEDIVVYKKLKLKQNKVLTKALFAAVKCQIEPRSSVLASKTPNGPDNNTKNPICWAVDIFSSHFLCFLIVWNMPEKNFNRILLLIQTRLIGLMWMVQRIESDYKMSYVAVSLYQFHGVYIWMNKNNSWNHRCKQKCDICVPNCTNFKQKMTLSNAYMFGVLRFTA